jgi:hypothetical protein
MVAVMELAPARVSRVRLAAHRCNFSLERKTREGTPVS